jgi:hypothetical protein
MPRRMLQTAPLGFAVNGGFGSFADIKKGPAYLLSLVLYGAPGAIRTPDRLVRSQVLYPAELRAHGRAHYTEIREFSKV